MPELPEVESLRRSLGPRLVGRRFEAVSVLDARLRVPVAVDVLVRMVGRRVLRLGRRSKYLLIDVDADARTGDGETTIVVHLGMSGTLRTVRREVPLERHDHVVFAIDDGSDLRYRDARRFGSLVAIPTAELTQHPAMARLGPEPLDPAFDAAYLVGCGRGRRAPVKTFIMDQRIVAGLGNIYVSEALYRAGISPRRRAGSIGPVRATRLVNAIRDVICAAIEAGGTTLRDYVDDRGRPGAFGSVLSVYGRAGEPCVQCGTAICGFVMAGRSTFYCGTCQR